MMLGTLTASPAEIRQIRGAWMSRGTLHQNKPSLITIVMKEVQTELHYSNALSYFSRFLSVVQYRGGNRVEIFRFRSERVWAQSRRNLFALFRSNVQKSKAQVTIFGANLHFDFEPTASYILYSQSATPTTNVRDTKCRFA